MATATVAVDLAASPKFAAFDIVDVDYKETRGVGIPASVLIPKNIQPGKHPLLVRWHGGCLITGHRLYPDWFATWILELALTKDAIIITPDYRLLPEVTGLEILDDVRDFFSWLSQPESLTSSLPNGVSVDKDNILVAGESAGGYLAIQSALLPASSSKVGVVIAQYPMIDFRDRYYTEAYDKQISRPPTPQLDPSILRDYLANMEVGGTIVSAVPQERMALVGSFIQQGMYGKLFGEDSNLYPLEVLEKVERLAPMWVLHGIGDTIIPVEGSYKFEQAVKQKFPEAKLHTTYRDGDHGFDHEEAADLRTGWVKEGVSFIDKYWPK